MQVNKIQSNNYNNQPKFGAFRIHSFLKEEYPEIVEAAIESPAIRNFIKKNEARNKNTRIYVDGINRYENNPHFYVTNSDNDLLLSVPWKNGAVNVINAIKSLDAAIRLPKKLKEMEEWVLSLSKK